MHEQIWMIFADAENGLEWNMLFALLRILFDPIRVSVEETAFLISEYQNKYSVSKAFKSKGWIFLNLYPAYKNIKEIPFYQDGNEDDDIQPWSLTKLVKKFRKIMENRLHHTKTGYMRPAEVEDYMKVN